MPAGREERSAGPEAAAGPPGKQGLLRSQEHGHPAPFHGRGLLYNGNVGGPLRQALELSAADLRMARLAAAEDEGHLDLVTLLEEPLGVAHFEGDIVLIRAGAQADPFDLGGLGLLRRLFLLLR